MPFEIVRTDITHMQVDAIVNAANTELQRGGGVCGAIFNAAGVEELQKACDLLSPIETGEAVITPGFRLPAKYIIHTAGPRYLADDPFSPVPTYIQAEQLLRNSYRNSLALGLENKCENIAFPLISSGIYGYPKAEALRIATEEITEFLQHKDLSIFLALFGKETLPPPRFNDS